MNACPASKCVMPETCQRVCIVDLRMQRLRGLAERMVVEATSLGLVLTIEQVDQQPLAMGNYRTEVSVRPARVRETASSILPVAVRG